MSPQGGFPLMRAWPLALVALLLGPAAMAEDAGAAPVAASGGLHVGDTFVYARQTWVEHANGTLDTTFQPGVVLHLRDVRGMLDEAGAPRAALLVDLAARPMGFGPDGLWQSAGDGARWQSATLLLDARTGSLFGLYTAGREDTEELVFEPEASILLANAFSSASAPCALVALKHAIAREDPFRPGPLDGDECHVLDRDLGRHETLREAPLEDATLRVLHTDAPESPGVSIWLREGSPLPSQFATRTTYATERGEENLTAVETLLPQTPHAGPSLDQARSNATLPPAVGPHERGAVSQAGLPPGDADVDFAYADAMDAFLQNPEAAWLQTYLAEHEEAVPTTLSYNTYTAPNGTWHRRSWYAVWSDPDRDGAYAAADSWRSTEGNDTRLHPTVVAELFAWKDPSRVHRLGLPDVPPTTITLADAIRTARRHLPADLASLPLNDISLETILRSPNGAIGGGSEGGTFHAWQLYLGRREVVWNVTDGEAAPMQRAFFVQLDPVTGNVQRVATRSEHLRYEPILPGGVAPLYDQPADALRIPIALATAPRFDAPPRWRWDAVTATGAAIAGGITLALLLSAALREVATRGLVLPLYARLDPARLLRHPTRRALVAQLQRAPGTSVADLARALDVSEGAARHHLRALARGRIVRRIARPGGPGYALASTDPRDATRARLARHPKTGAILATLEARPHGMRLREVAAAAGADRGTAYHHLMRLTAAGLVDVERSQGRLLFRPAATRAEAAPFQNA